ncbi:MAG: hypothetical protein KA807_15850 [Prolixibacteraceae bacterium]|nr:hypothetical protein [Prolixibacteraceae bacterium]
MNNKVQMVLHSILEKFKTGDVPKAIAYAMFPVIGIPSDKWSYMNKMIMFLSGTIDARGIRQWNRVGRSVKSGAKAIYILVPYFVKGKRRIEDDENEILKGFLAKPVFRVEDTEGALLEYEKKIPLPDLPLLERAKEWGITVSTIAPDRKFLGVYISNIKEIAITSPEEIVFFHELAHAAYELCIGKLKPGQRWDQEITAELSAQALCHLTGKAPGKTLGNTYWYIERYAAEADLKPITACLQVIHDVEMILNFILGKEVTNHVERTIERAA